MQAFRYILSVSNLERKDGGYKIVNLNRNRFVFVLVDDFSRFTWIFFLEHKDQAFSYFNIFRKRVEKEKNSNFTP